MFENYCKNYENVTVFLFDKLEMWGSQDEKKTTLSCSIKLPNKYIAAKFATQGRKEF